jgi:cytochrome c oxidase cbb3-type subunit III
MAEDITDNKNNIEPHDDSHDHEYDGIKELKNPAPYWVLLLFFVTIAFSGMYAIKYFGYPNNKMDQANEYKASVEEQKQKMKLAAGKGNAMNDKEKIAAGEKLFKEKGCVVCHGAMGEGNKIGPNLCDNFWISGCTPEDVVKTITEGRPEKGMTPFKAILSEAQIDQVATYILESLAGTNPTGGKEAQGTECK